MANPTDFVYGPARFAFATAGINWLTATVKCALVSANYSALPTHSFISDIPPGALIVRSASLTGLNVNGSGVCSGVIPSFESFLAVDPIAAMILYIDSGNDASSKLVYYSSTGVGFPFSAQGFDYFVGFDLANGGWFQV